MFDLSKIRKPQYSCESHHGGFGSGPLWLVYARIFPTGQLFTRNLFKQTTPRASDPAALRPHPTRAGFSLRHPIMHEAVVITQAAPVRVSPVPIEEPVFVLPEASVVRMMEEHEGFVLIRTEAGRTGWAQRSNLAPIVPCTQANGSSSPEGSSCVW